MRFSSQRFDYFYDIETLRTFIDASAAPHAGIEPFVLRGIIDQLMHKPLAVSLQLGGTAVGRGHQGKIGIHARIPATVADNALLGFEIADIEALMVTSTRLSAKL